MFTEQQKKDITSEILKRADGHIGVCPVCRNPNWILGDGVTTLVLQDKPGVIVIGGPVLPCVSIVCTKCGNTQLLNLILLGFGDLLKTQNETPEADSPVKKQEGGTSA